MFHSDSNPKAPWRDNFLNLDPSNWERYDIDWPEFNAGNLNYLNIGIPPVVNQNYRHRYMFYWNQQLPSELNRTLYQRKPPPFADLYAPSPTRLAAYATSSPGPPGAHVIYYSDKTTEDPIRMLQYLLQHPHLNRSDLHQIQSTAGTETSADASAATPTDHTYALGDNQIAVKADSTLNMLIGMVIVFLVINLIIFSVYAARRIYYNRKMKRKLDVLSLDGTTDDDLKRSMKFNDGDESFILDIVRRKNEYVPVKRYHSPINGFLLSRHYSTSTVDTHTKVSDWISQEVNRQSLKENSKILFGPKSEKVSVGIDATPNARSDSILRQHPIELMKSKSFDYPKDMIICQDVDVRRDLLDSVHLREAHRANSIPSLRGLSPAPMAEILRIDHRPTRSDPVTMQYTRPPSCRNEDITSFIEDVDVNVTSRDECDGADTHFPLTPQETLQIYQMRNYPKVLPRYPEDCSEYVSTSSFKRRSMPSHQCLINQYVRVPPAPPPRTTSTLGRNSSIKSNSSNLSDLLLTTSPVQRAIDPMTLDEEPEIAYNVLHVGPLLPGSKENLYSTMKRVALPMAQTASDEAFTNPVSQYDSPASVDTVDSVRIDTLNTNELTTDAPANEDNSNSAVKPPSGFKTRDDRNSLIPKPNVKLNLMRQNSNDSNKINSAGNSPQDTPGSKIPTLRNSHGSSSSSGSSNGSNQTNSSNGSKDSAASSDSHAFSDTSAETASSTGTIKQIF